MHVWSKKKSLIPIEAPLNTTFGSRLRRFLFCSLPQCSGDHVVRVPELSRPWVGDSRQSTSAWRPPVRGKDRFPNHQNPNLGIGVPRQEFFYCGGPPQTCWSSRRQEKEQARNICIGVKSCLELAEIHGRERDERLLSSRNRRRPPQINGNQQHKNRDDRDKDCSFRFHLVEL